MPCNYRYINGISKRATILNESVNRYNRYPIRLFYNTTYIYYIEREIYNKVIYILYK
jgi:hypothetical protein